MGLTTAHDYKRRVTVNNMRRTHEVTVPCELTEEYSGDSDLRDNMNSWKIE